MGKVYFYALDLARISALHMVPVGKVPPAKLDLARSRAFASPHPASPHPASSRAAADTRVSAQLSHPPRT